MEICIWIQIRTDSGAILAACWYRPPSTGEISSMNGMISEWTSLQDLVLGLLGKGADSEAWLAFHNVARWRLKRYRLCSHQLDHHKC